MILPTKRIGANRSLLGVGGEILRLLNEPKTVSRLWDDYKKATHVFGPPNFEAVVLGLDLLFAIGALEYSQGRIVRTEAPQVQLQQVPGKLRSTTS